MRALALILLLPALAAAFFLGTRFAANPANPVAAAEGPEADSATPVQAPAVSPGTATVPTPIQPTALEPAGGLREQRSSASEAETEEVAEVESEPPSPETEQLMALLQEFLTSGKLEERYRSDASSLANFLFHNFLELEDPWAALKVLEIHDLGEESWGSVARVLHDQGQTGSARELFLKALRMDPDDGEWIGYLRELDPVGALSILEETLLENPELAGSEIGAGAIRLLMASGQVEEARRRIEELLSQEYVNPETWELLVELDPELAEERLREAATDDPFGETRLRLAQLLLDKGSTDELVGLLEGILVDVPGSWDALYMLQEVDPAASVAVLEGRIAAGQDDSYVWGNLGDQLLELGRTDEAIEAWFTAFEREPDDTSWSWRLLEHAPERFFPLFEQRTRETNDDEMWGDLADAYWRSGRYQDAQAAWESARRLDPDDGEWTGKLQSLKDGVDPLGEGDLIGLGYLGYGSNEVIEIDGEFPPEIGW